MAGDDILLCAARLSLVAELQKRKIGIASRLDGGFNTFGLFYTQESVVGSRRVREE